MTGYQAAYGVWAILALMLVGSGLLTRRVPLRTTVGMTSAWVGIFALVFVMFLFRDVGTVIWDRAVADVGGVRPLVSGHSVQIPMADDGHFWVEALVNGIPVRFLIDSGATTTGLSNDVAQASGVVADNMIPIPVNTANGTIEVSTASIASLKVGPIEQSDAKAVIGGPTFGNNVLGMSFLSSLKRWRVERRT